MNRWKLTAIVLSVVLAFLLISLTIRMFTSFTNAPTSSELDAYIDAAQEWVHAEEQMKLSVGEAIKVTDTAEGSSTPEIENAIADLNALISLDPPTVPSPVAGLNDDGLFDGNFAPLRSEVQKMPAEEVRTQTRQIIEASEKAEERARAVTRRADKVASLLLSPGH